MNTMNDEQLARLFEETYSRLASQGTPPLDERIVRAACREILQGRVLIDRRTIRKSEIKYG